MKTLSMAVALAVMLSTMTLAKAKAQNMTEVYKTKCAACHGVDGKGDTAAGKKFGARDFHSAEVQKMTDKELFDVTKDGKAKMPKYAGKLTDDQIRDLVKYVRELGKK
jgi:cytochrome c6